MSADVAWGFNCQMPLSDHVEPRDILVSLTNVVAVSGFASTNFTF
ncbi:hypothetical protein [Limnohabitans sp. 103DPR2]|nr:hypothetical protein [Limnohabitans sp. 103DPR2]